METLEIKDKTKTKDMLLSFGLLAALFVLLVILEHTIRPTSILFTVLKKGAIYALVAVSMNLLNGFTGLFSLGQAGFMLLALYEDTNGEGRLHDMNIPTFLAMLSQKP